MCCDFADAHPLTTAQAMGLPQARAESRIAYGPGPLQFGELRWPDSPLRTSGLADPVKVPIAIVIHGGCWMAEHDLAYMRNVSAALAQAGIATWLVEYRRVGDPGGGWPGTFHDVGAAADYVRELAKQYPLDMTRVIAVGHSAGGHLALWLAARHKLQESCELYIASPIALRGVVSLAGIPDLAQAGAGNVCDDMAYQLLGGTPDLHPGRYAAASPAELLPLGIKQVLLHGEADQHVPHQMSAAYEQRARRSGDPVELISVPKAGHFELVVPTSAAWNSVASAALALVK